MGTQYEKSVLAVDRPYIWTPQRETLKGETVENGNGLKSYHILLSILRLCWNLLSFLVRKQTQWRSRHFQLVPKIKPEETRESLWDDWLPAQFSVSWGPFSSFPASPLLHRGRGGLSSSPTFPRTSAQTRRNSFAWEEKQEQWNTFLLHSHLLFQQLQSQTVHSWWKAENSMSVIKFLELTRTDVQTAHWATS